MKYTTRIRQTTIHTTHSIVTRFAITRRKATMDLTIIILCLVPLALMQFYLRQTVFYKFSVVAISFAYCDLAESVLNFFWLEVVLLVQRMGYVRVLPSASGMACSGFSHLALDIVTSSLIASLRYQRFVVAPVHCISVSQPCWPLISCF